MLICSVSRCVFPLRPSHPHPPSGISPGVEAERGSAIFTSLISHLSLSLPSFPLASPSPSVWGIWGTDGSDERPEFCMHAHICFQSSVSFWFKPMKVFRCLAATERNICYQLFTFFCLRHFPFRLIIIFSLVSFCCTSLDGVDFSILVLAFSPLVCALPLPLSITVRL